MTKFAAKYWLETTIGIVAGLVLLVGLIVSQSNHQPPLQPPAGDAASVPATGGLALGVLPDSPRVTVDSLKIGGQKQPVRFGPSATIVLTEGQGLELTGWAIDPSTKTAPVATFVQVDGFARAQGLISDRADVAQALKVPDYEKSGFDITVPSQLLPLGKHRLAFLAEDAKRTGYLVIPAWATVVVQARNLNAARQLPGKTKYSLDRIVVGNHSPIGATEEPSPATVHSNEPVVFEGWAIDSVAKAPAGGVAAIIDGKRDIVGTYGIAAS